MPTVREYEQTLQSDPAHSEAFLGLRKAYRESNQFDKLVILYETRAQAIDDPAKAAELFYLAAEVRIDHLGDESGAEADLAHAVDRDPTHLKATKRLKDVYRAGGRTAEYMTMLEMEAAAVARTKDPARIAELQTEMAQIESQVLSRLEKAMASPASRAEVTAEHLKTVESARKIYRALTDYQSVVRLYELELGATSDAKRRAELLLGWGRVLGEKLGDLEGAAQRIGEVVRLRPRDDKALEALAGVYANPKWIGADGPERAAALFHQVARRRAEAGDVDNAIAVLRKALGAVPGQAEASDLLERVLYDANRLQDLDRYYRERVGSARSEEERMDFLFKRAQLAESDLADPAEALRAYEEIVAIEPPGGPASQHLAKMYLTSQDYGKLAELREKQLEAASEPAFRLTLLTELASLYRDRLGDKEQAAVYLHAILQADPGNAEALQAYADHFRARGDWRELVDLLEFALEHAQGAGAPADVLVPRLEEVAVIAESKLGDSERALSAWQKLETLSPGYERAREAQKRILLKAKQWDRMVTVLEREAQNASDPAQKVEILRRLARVHIEKLNAPERAAAVYQQILAQDPRDLVALRALMESYERGERWGELTSLLREQLELVSSKQEKLTHLRRLLVLFDERLGDLAQGSWAAAEILKLVPGDREALTRLEAILERSDDKERLVQTLEYHTRYTATAEEKVHLIHRIADLLQNSLGDVEKATPYWEQLAKLAPGDPAALDALATAYEKLNKPEDLARVLEQQISRSAGDTAAQAECLRRLARLCNETLDQPARAQRGWEDLLKVLPTDREALEELSLIYEQKGEWRALVSILERRIPLAADPANALILALERARVLEEDLRNADEAMRALEQIISELDPRSIEAHERLRKVAEQKQDWARVVSVAERQLFLTEEPTERAARALEIGLLWRDRLEDPTKAMAAFERVIEIDPNHAQALYALAPLYQVAGDSERLIFTDERLLQQATDPGERRRLMFEIADTCQTALGEARMAFEWYRRAYQEKSDDETLAKLESVAEAHGLWEDLIQVYAGERARSGDPAEQLEVALKVAGLCEQRLKSPVRAFLVLRDAIPADPTGAKLLPELERLAGETNDWKGLLDVYARVAHGRPTAEERVELLEKRAHVREERLADPSGALEENLRSFALKPEREETHREILRLAEATGRWEDALNVQGQIFARAATVDEKVEVARKAAALVEEKVRDRVRAFRAYLNAFRLAPEDEGIIANLWRLGALIGKYEEPGSGAIRVTDTPPGERPRPEPTMALQVEDLVPVVQRPKNEATMALSLDDLEDASEIGEEDLEDIEELTDAEGTQAPPPAPPPRRLGAFETPWEELASAYERLPAGDNETRMRHLKRVADVWERGAKDIDRAIQALERAFHLDLSDTEVRETLRRLASTENRWDEVCAIYLRGVEAAGREDAVALEHEVARFREQLGQTAQAEERYQAILLLKPEDPLALNHLEHMYRSAERWDELAGILEKRTTGSLEALPPGAERRRRALELAELQEQRLERPYEAIDTLERYVTSIDEDERGLDNPEVTREAGEAYEALARLYSRVGLWPKVVAALYREAELSSDPNVLRGLRWRIGEIQERELGAVEQAVEAYESILAALPEDEEALAALDRLHQAHGNWEPLQDILRRRADLTSGSARGELIRRRAKILEDKLGNPDAAAACLRSLGAEAVSDDESTEALLRNLRSAGLAHEALRVVNQRIDVLVKEGGDPSRLVAWHLELGDLQNRMLDDDKAARRSIEAALQIAPEDTTALAALAKLHLEHNDFASYAEVRLRQARAVPGTPEAAAALLEAGAVYRDQLGNPAEARVCFERAVKAHPSNPEALHALAVLLASDGQVDEARALFERQLEVIEEPTAKAAVLTHLARTIWENPSESNVSEAIVRLDQALELAPDYLPAVMTMADIYYKEHQWDQAERRLNQVLRRTRGQPEETAKLYHRLAEVYDKLGRIEEGYRQLVEADRVSPGQLLIRIALGENRFQARKWRDAVGHLEGIADHPDAAKYPDEVAQALTHEAQAQIKLKHPERAVLAYEAALRFSPEHRPSLKALADLALERGEKAQAAQYLRRVAESSGDRAERVKLFEQLGDLHHGLEDDISARVAYESAMEMIEQPDETHVPLLQKALGLQRTAGAVREATETALRISEAVTDGKERAVRRREVAALLVAEGDFSRAAAILEKALVDNPRDEEVLLRVCEAYDRANRTEELEALLARTLPDLPPIQDKPAARKRRADLWDRLGSLRRRRDPAAAIAAFENAVAADPERVSARAALAALYADRPEYAEVAQRNNRLLVMADVTNTDALRALAISYAEQGRIDSARCCYEVLELLGAADSLDHAFMQTNPAPALKPEHPYSGAIEEADRVRYLAHPEARVLAEVFASIWEGVPGLGKVTLETLGVSAGDKVSPISEQDIGKVYGQTSKALDNKRTNLYINYDPQFEGVALVMSPPPAIVIDKRLANEAETPEARFRLGRALELTRPEYILAATIPPREFASLFSSVLKAFHPRHARWRAGEKSAEQVAKLKKLLPYKVAKRLAELFQESHETPFSSARWRTVVLETGARAGLLMCGDLRVAATIVLQEQEANARPDAETLRDVARIPGPLRELLRFAVSDEYFLLRESLGTSLSKAAAA
jgi:tetratricopeptide (TPR) repeat protein